MELKTSIIEPLQSKATKVRESVKNIDSDKVVNTVGKVTNTVARTATYAVTSVVSGILQGITKGVADHQVGRKVQDIQNTKAIAELNQ